MPRVLRYTTGIGTPETFTLYSPPLAFAAPGDEPEFWAEEDYSRQPGEYALMVVGTGWEIPAHARHLLTAARSDTGHVWHLYRLEES